MCDCRTMKAFIIEISCPFDAFIDTCYHTQFQYYKPLHEHINLDTGYACKTIVIIVGLVHKRLTSGLKMIGFTNRRSKTIAKYLNIRASVRVLAREPSVRLLNGLFHFYPYFPRKKKCKEKKKKKKEKSF